MSHEIHTTDALILSSQPIKEANKFFKILTKDFGLVNATAQNVRSINSKLKYSLQDLSFLRISLVNGREVWRITNAIPDNNILTALPFSDSRRHALLNIVNLIKNLVHGEESESKLFDIVYSAFIFLSSKEFLNLPGQEEQIKSLLTSSVQAVENITVLRILYVLGYLNSDDKFNKLLEKNIYTDELFVLEEENRKEILKTINKVLTEI